MEIFVNGELLNYELENEKNVHDIVTELGNHFASDQPQRFITSIIIDGKEYSYADDDGLRALLIQDVQRCEFEFNDIIGVSLMSIRQISLYLEFLSEIIDRDSWDESILKVIDSLSWMRQGVNQIVNIFGKDQDNLSTLKNRFFTRYQVLENTFTALSEADFPLGEDRKNEILLSIKDVQEVLAVFYNSINHNESTAGVTGESGLVLEEVVEELKNVQGVLTDVPLLLQKGDDKGAMEVVQLLTRAIDNSLSLFMMYRETSKAILDSLTVNGESLDVFFGKMTANLKELMHSMEIKDSVMIGDLIEYEFIPYTEELARLLSELKNSDGENIN